MSHDLHESLRDNVRILGDNLGQTIDMAGYSFRFDGVRSVQGPNYHADRGTIVVLRDGSEVSLDALFDLQQIAAAVRA